MKNKATIPQILIAIGFLFTFIGCQTTDSAEKHADNSTNSSTTEISTSTYTVKVYRWTEEYKDGRIDTLYGSLNEAKDAWKADTTGRSHDNISIVDVLYTADVILYDTVDLATIDSLKLSSSHKAPKFDKSQIPTDTIQFKHWIDGFKVRTNFIHYPSDSAKITILEAPEWVKVGSIGCGFEHKMAFDPCPVEGVQKYNESAICDLAPGWRPSQGIYLGSHPMDSNYTVELMVSNKFGWSDTLSLYIDEKTPLMKECPNL